MIPQTEWYCENLHSKKPKISLGKNTFQCTAVPTSRWPFWKWVWLLYSGEVLLLALLYNEQQSSNACHGECHSVSDAY